jgi:AraC-like DNA-binding protein
MTGAPMNTVMLALLMMSAGAMITMAAAMWRAPRPLVRWTGIMFDVSVAAYAIKSWNDEVHLLPGLVAIPIVLLTVGAVGWFWLFVVALFQDACRIKPSMYAAVGVLTVISFVGHLLGGVLEPLCWLVANLIQIGMALHVLMIVAQGWKGDLVEARRRLRGPFLLTVTAYILVTRGFDIWGQFGTLPAWYPMTNAGVLAVVCLAGAFVFVESRDELFGTTLAPVDVLRTPVRVTAAANGNGHALVANGAGSGHIANGNGLDRAAKADLDRLQALMTSQQIWREEGLTIASLAVRAGMPEAQLRRLINDCLGYRNFPSYVNAHRIAAAKTRLSDPNEARISISAIAFDIGFASLGPFNRAFKEATGVSPSEWRRGALNEPSPIPEKV